MNELLERRRRARRALSGRDSGARGRCRRPRPSRVSTTFASRFPPARATRRDVLRAARRARLAGDDGDGRAALLRLRDRRLAARRAGGELARDGVGSERGVRLRRRRPSRCIEAGRAATGCSTCSGLPAGLRRRIRHRRHDGELHRARRRAPRGARRGGWDVEADGLFGAPPITVVVGAEAHPTLLKALGLVGFGRNRVVRVPVDGQGRMRADALPPLSAARRSSARRPAT